VSLLAAVESGRVDWVGSAYLEFEVEQDAVALVSRR